MALFFHAARILSHSIQRWCGLECRATSFCVCRCPEIILSQGAIYLHVLAFLSVLKIRIAHTQVIKSKESEDCGVCADRSEDFLKQIESLGKAKKKVHMAQTCLIFSDVDCLTSVLHFPVRMRTRTSPPGGRASQSNAHFIEKLSVVAHGTFFTPWLSRLRG